MTNLLVGRAVHQGVAWTSDAGLRPEWAGAKATITVDQLMRMTSGLSWDETYELGTPITTMLYREPNMAAYAASLELAHEPGSYQQYSSGITTSLCAYLREGQRVVIVPSADLVLVRMGFGPGAEEMRITPLISDLVNDLG